jgi:hypothetical protein
MKIHPRIRKEARVLFWPWCVTMLALYEPVVSRMFWPQPPKHFPGPETADLFVLLVALVGSALLAALTLGEEFSCRTMPMLLIQPRSRLRLWGEKMLVQAAFLIPLGLTLSISIAVVMEGDLGASSALILCFFALSASAGFWTLVARSTLGGVVFAVASLLAVLAASAWVESEFFAIRTITGPFTVSGGILGYAALSLWFGWRKFSRIELNTPDGSETGINTADNQTLPAFAALRPRASSPQLNLLRKELRLQLPVVLISLVSAACWLLLAVTGHSVLVWGNNETPLLMCGLIMHAAIVLTLAGCLPLCEERSLGLHLANLTLPVPAARQWLLKLGVALAVGLLAGVALPAVLWQFTHNHPVNFWERRSVPGFVPAGEDGGWPLYGALGCLLVALGLWSATLLPRMTKAFVVVINSVPALVLALMAGGGSALYGLTKWPFLLKGAQDALAGCLVWLISSSAITWRHAGEFAGWLQNIRAGTVWWFGTLVVFGAVVAQSRRQFRRPPPGSVACACVMARLWAGVFCVAMLLVLAFGALLNACNLTLAIPQQTAAALGIFITQSKAASSGFATRLPLAVSLAELESTGWLKDKTRTLLKHSKVELIRSDIGGRTAHGETTYWLAKIIFPDGYVYLIGVAPVDWEISEAAQAFLATLPTAPNFPVPVTVEQLEAAHGALSTEALALLSKRPINSGILIEGYSSFPYVRLEGREAASSNTYLIIEIAQKPFQERAAISEKNR